MTPKQYLKQAYRLDKHIIAMNEELKELRRLSTTVQSLQFKERVQTGFNTEAQFIKVLNMIDEYEERIAKRMELFVSLKNQISMVISKVENSDEQLVLFHRYLLGETWEKIGENLFADERTIRRWHTKALQQVVLPDDAIKL